MRFFYICSAVLIGMTSSLSAKALDNRQMVPLVLFSGGIFNVQRDAKSAQFELQYKFAVDFFMARPQIGGFATSKGATYLYAGFGWDLHFSRFLVVTPSFSAGYYQKGKDKDLGYPIEFRTCAEVAYLFRNKSRLGFQFYHLSNASLSSRNPGEESLTFFYALPLNH